MWETIDRNHVAKDFWLFEILQILLLENNKVLYSKQVSDLFLSALWDYSDETFCSIKV